MVDNLPTAWPAAEIHILSAVQNHPGLGHDQKRLNEPTALACICSESIDFRFSAARIASQKEYRKLLLTPDERRSTKRDYQISFYDIREPDEHIFRLNPTAETMYWIQLGGDFDSRVWAKESELEVVE